MRRRFLVLAALSGLGFLVACAAEGSSAPDDETTSTPSTDAGRTSKAEAGTPEPTEDAATDSGEEPGTDGGTDGGTKDSGTTDSGTKDSGTADGGTKDGGSDGGVADGGTDAGDGGPADGGTDAGDGGPCSYSGTLVTYDMNALTGTAAKADPTTVNAGLTATAITRVGVSGVSANGGLNANNWPNTATANAGKYFTLSFTAPAGCAVATSSITLDLKSSSSGPTKAGLATSADAYATETPATVTTVGGATTVAVVTDTAAGGTLEVRIYGYSAALASGTMRVEDVLSIQGNLH